MTDWRHDFGTDCVGWWLSPSNVIDMPLKVNPLSTKHEYISGSFRVERPRLASSCCHIVISAKNGMITCMLAGRLKTLRKKACMESPSRMQTDASVCYPRPAVELVKNVDVFVLILTSDRLRANNQKQAETYYDSMPSRYRPSYKRHCD